ncbi:hypothetical protein CsatB_012504 [Cannabis sativa]
MINENFLVESALKKFPHYVLMEEVKNGIEVIVRVFATLQDRNKVDFFKKREIFFGPLD